MPEYRNKGYAQQAIAEAERIHGEQHWKLDTILQEKGTCYLYEKLGYHQTGKTEQINDKMTIVYYEKDWKMAHIMNLNPEQQEKYGVLGIEI